MAFDSELESILDYDKRLNEAFHGNDPRYKSAEMPEGLTGFTLYLLNYGSMPPEEVIRRFKSFEGTLYLLKYCK